MNAPFRPDTFPTDPADFVVWATRQERKVELVDGRLVVHPGVTKNHGRIVHRLSRFFGEALDERYDIYTSDLAIRTPIGIRYPDLVIAPRDDAALELVVDEPVLVAEVLSVTSLARDLREKPEEYLALPSLRAYLVVAQDAPITWLFERGDDGAFPAQPTMIDGAEATVEIAGLGLSLPHARLYRGLPGLRMD